MENILEYAAGRDTRSAAAIAARVRKAEKTIATLPLAARLDRETGLREAIVHNASLLLVYEIVTIDNHRQAEIVAVFHTSRDPSSKPGRRE